MRSLADQWASSFAVVLVGAMVSTSAMAGGTPEARGTNGPAKARLPGTTWQSIAHLPDWSGVWELDWRAGAGRGAMGMPKLTPDYQAHFDKYRAEQKEGKNQQTQTANCDPPGMPQIMTQPYPVEFLFTPGKVTVAIEAYSQMRRIFVDGRPHQEDPDPTYQGDSIGHWEGDTLVVNSVGFIPDSLIMPGIGHSDQMAIEERIRRVSPDTLEIRRTITDPKVLTEPWTVTLTYKRHADWDIKEYICAQNNRDSADSEGRADMNLKR
jgi:hypothetical protein